APVQQEQQVEQEPTQTQEAPTQEESQQNTQSDGQSSTANENKYIQQNQEWRQNSSNGLSSGETQLKQEILNGTYEGEDSAEIMEAIEYYEQQYGQ
ncbi:hypothetical protein ACH0BJ_12775, partial [Staphylococcus arlettae]